MVSNLRVDPAAKKIENLPEGWVVLFLARISSMGALLFAAIICPEDACLGTTQHPHRELDGKAKLVLFTAENVRSYDIHHGHKYAQGGGMIEIDRDGQGASWTTPDTCGRNEVFGHRIPLEDVLVAL